MKLEGIIQKNGTVLGDDGDTYFLPCRGTDKEGFPEVLMDAKTVGGSGSFQRQSIKPYVGMKVDFVYNIKSYGFNYEIISNEKEEKNNGKK